MFIKDDDPLPQTPSTFGSPLGENLVECQVIYLCSDGPKPAQAKAVPHGDTFSGQGQTEEGLGDVLVLIQPGISLQTVPNFHQHHMA